MNREITLPANGTVDPSCQSRCSVRTDRESLLVRLQSLDWNGGPDFPVPPQAVIEFSNLSRQPNVRVSELSQIVENEPALTAELLKNVNSSVNGFRHKVDSVAQAIALLGISNCTSIFLTRALDRALSEFESPLISNSVARRESLERARFAREVAVRLDLDPILSYTAATLQDILLPLLTRRHQREYAGYLDFDVHEGIEEFELETFGWTHAEVTAKTLLDWGFPESLIFRVLLHHESPEELFVADGPLHEVTPNAIASLLNDELQQARCGVTRLVDLQRFHPRLQLLEIADVVDQQLTKSAGGVASVLPLVNRIQFAMLDQIERRRKDSIALGRQFGNYVLEEKIAESSMGAIFRAKHIMLRRPTAIKFLRADKVTKESIRQFEREVQLTSTLSHPNTISIFDYGHTPDDLFYYAMQLIDGLTLDKLIKTAGPISDGRALLLLQQICGSLAEAHASGLVHRDIKPQNIMISAGVGCGDQITVLDFGLVTEVQTQSDSSPTIQGTPLFISPEAAQCRSVIDARSDLYSVAAVAYFLLTGQPVFNGNTHQVLSHHSETPPVAPSHVTENPIATELEQLLMMCLSKEPDDRPESAIQMLEQLSDCAVKSPWSTRDSIDWWDRDLSDPSETTWTTDEGEDTVIAEMDASLTAWPD